MRLRPHLVTVERLVDSVRLARRRGRPPEHFRIEAYGGHGGPHGVVVRGRVLDDPPPTEALEGEGVGAAVRRTLAGFLTHELPGVPLRVEVAGAATEVETDGEGYFTARLSPGAEALAAAARGAGAVVGVVTGTVSLARPHRGLTGDFATPALVHTSPAGARFGVVSDVDDTILETGVQRLGLMLRQTLTGSALTRTPFAGAPELYRDLASGAAGASGANPFFYVSSSPWNLHAFLAAFLRHRDFPPGPLLLRDLLGTRAGREAKHGRIREVLALHPDLRFVLIGDSGEHDPQVYADVVREHPGRVLAVYIREVRLDPGDGRVEAVSEGWAREEWGREVPFVLAADSDAVRRHAATLGLL